jgi:hypothetical protein
MSIHASILAVIEVDEFSLVNSSIQGVSSAAVVSPIESTI